MDCVVIIPPPLVIKDSSSRTHSFQPPRAMTHSSLAIANPKFTSYFPPAIPNSNYLSCRTTRRGQPRLKIWSKIDDGSVDKFIQSNSIADFMRFKKDSDAQLQTAMVSYRKKFPWSFLQPFLQVDLVSNVHIADKEYFETLEDVLEPYDCVLYEMVTSRENLESRRELAVRKKVEAQQSRGFNILGFIQRQIAKLLVLDFQLDCLDYERDNWYHADLDLETFKILQLEKGESFFTFARDITVRSTKVAVQSTAIREDLGPWRSKLLWASRIIPMPLVGLFIIGSLCADTGPEAFPELEALSRLDFGSALKIFLAKRLSSELPQLTSGEVEKSVIIGERNRAATQALHHAIRIGNNKIAILYGGGHMPDLSRRLQEEFDLVPSGVRWITAWSIRNKNLTSTSLPFLTTLARLTRWPLNRYQTLALLIFSSVLALDLLFWELFLNWVSNVALDILQYIHSARFI